jgi:cytosine/adenosine deaminase-related metal-dependent hydrolase
VPDRTLLTGRWVVGHAGGGHRLYQHGEVVVEGDRVLFVGHAFPGVVARRLDVGQAIIAPGFIDLDALSDLDTTILGFDNQPSWKKGRIWPRSYIDAGPFEMYDRAALAFQKRHAFATLIRNGITTALPIASLFYRAWGETVQEFTDAADAAEALGLRVYLGPAYRSGNLVVEADGRITEQFDEARGLDELAKAIAFCAAVEGRASGRIRAMLAPDRIETCTPELLRRTAAAGRDLGVPVRLHCCQSSLEYDTVLRLRGMSSPEYLLSTGFLHPRVLLPHGTHVSGAPGVARPGNDLEIIRDSGASLVHCPLVSARHGSALRSFARVRAMGINIGLGTDTAPPDMILNMQIGLMLCRLLDGNMTACRSEDMFDAATLGGARALGRGDLGRLEAGAKADLIVVDLDRPHIGQVIDPIQTLLLSAHGRDVASVMIDGRWVMRDRIIPEVDETADAARAQAQLERLIALYPQRTFGHPPVEEIFSSSYPIEAGPSPGLSQ